MKKDIDIAKKGIRLADEILNLTKKGKGQDVMIDDYPTVKDCFENNKTAQQFIETFGEKKLMRGEGKQHEVERLVLKLNSEKRKLLIRGRIIKYSSTIAAAVLVASFVVWYAIDAKPPIREVAHLNVQKPILILNNGENVDLTHENDATNNNYTVNRTGHLVIYAGTTGSDGNEMEYNTIVVPSRYTYNVILADGSEVKLNANSELRYPVKFGTDRREVFLKGEGYFTVSKSAIPFIVSTAEVDVKVYGTVFNINLHRKGVVEAVLVEGSVGVETKNLKSNSEVMITPSQKFSLDLGKEEIQVTQVNVENDVNWINNYFQCDETSLENLIGNISSWYGADFSFANAEDKGLKVTVTLSRELEVDELLSILESTLEIKFIKLKNNCYEIDKK